MLNARTGLRSTTPTSNEITNLLESEETEQPQRRYTEGSDFREKVRFEANVGSNRYLDIQPDIRRSLSEDFQDSLEFYNLTHGTMTSSGGTNSLPAFLSGPPAGSHTALLHQLQSNQRAVDNDYCEQPPPCHFIKTQTRPAETHRSRHSRRHRQQNREPSGRRYHTRSSSHQRSNREEGTHPAFRDHFVTTSADRHTSRHRDIDFDNPPPRPPLSKYHIEHRYAGRALRVSSSLPASLTFNTGDSVLVPMRHNAPPSRRHHREKTRRHRENDSVGPHIQGSQRGYSLTPPPVCRANKPRYDVHNRLIQTVSSPSVVTQSTDSSWRSNSHPPVRPTPKLAQPTSKKNDLSFTQPTHVVLSQPKRKSKKQLMKEELENDEISQQKKGLVVSLNNNIATKDKPKKDKSKDISTKMSSISSKSSDTAILKKEECTPMLPTEDSSHHQSQENVRVPLKPGEPCPQCGNCNKQSKRETRARCRSSAHCWTCNQRCLCNVDTCVETATCVCCVKGLFYHCLSHEDEDSYADEPCSCQSDKRCLRWTLMGMLSLCLPCLCCYPIARGCVKICRTCSGCVKSGCQCRDSYR
ncbi:uncharacterized protein LOC144431945 [Styela clava]